MNTAQIVDVLATAVLAAVQQLAVLLLMEEARQEEILEFLRLFDRNDVQDFLDGVGASRGRQEIPPGDRFWLRVGQWMPSRTFFTLFRCTRPTFAKLVAAVYGTTDMRPADGGRGPEFNPCERSAMALYRLGHGAGVRATAALFGVSDGWVCNQTKDFVKRACEVLTPTYMRWPTRNEQDCIADAFEERTGFRNAILAMDGSHIPIPAPSGRDMSAYYNYKGFYYVILLAVVDSAGIFRWISCGSPGACGDAGVWRWCLQSKRIAADQLLPEPSRTQVCHDRYILGDSAFGNLSWLLTPWDAPSSRAQRFFNYVHSQTRFIVEHAFGRLKWNFMCLKNRMYFKIEAVPDVIRACVVLYNFILTEDGVGENEVFMDDMPTRRARASRASSGAAAAAGVGSAAVGGASVARQRETDYRASTFMVEMWGEEGSAVDRARKEAEARYRAAPTVGEGGRGSAAFPHL